MIRSAHRYVAEEEVGWIEMQGDCGVGAQHAIQT